MENHILKIKASVDALIFSCLFKQNLAISFKINDLLWYRNQKPDDRLLAKKSFLIILIKTPL